MTYYNLFLLFFILIFLFEKFVSFQFEKRAAWELNMKP